jgi:hypothetical protein
MLICAKLGLDLGHRLQPNAPASQTRLASNQEPRVVTISP